jgi:Ca-activated chloride channel family protein
MNSVHWQNPDALLWLWLLPLLAGLFLWAAWRRRQALARWAGPAAAPASPVRRLVKAALVLLALALLLVALGRPGWVKEQREVERRGRDTVFLLDVSRSMLAEDVAPNRLERSKLMIRDALETMEGNRAALVLFAGSASVKCPLTTDHGFLRTILDDVSWDSVERGGSNLGDALRKTLDSAFDATNVRCRDLILITDGEDQDSFPVEAARKLGEAGVRLVIIGIGDAAGSRIPIVDRQGRRHYLTYQNGDVRTKLQAATLREMASAASGGRYYHVGTDTLDLGAICAQLAKEADTAQFKDAALERYREEFQGLLFLALLLLLSEAMVGDRLRAPVSLRSVNGSWLVGLLLALLSTLSAAANEPVSMDKLSAAASLVQQGNALYRQGNYAEAQKRYQQAAATAPAAPEPSFNHGLALCRQKQFDSAATAFDEAVTKASGELRDRSELNAARNRLDQAGALAKATPQDAKALQKALELAERSSGDLDSLRRENRVAGETAPWRELAHRQVAELKRQIEELRKQQEQQRQQLKDQLEKQQQLRQDNQKNQQQAPSQQPPEAQKQADRQQQLQQETEKLKQSQPGQEQKPQSQPGQEQKPQPQPGQEQKQDPLDQASRQQQQAAQDLKQNKLKEAEAHQKQAEEQLREALRQLEQKEQKGKAGEKTDDQKPEKPEAKPEAPKPAEQAQEPQAQEPEKTEEGITPDDLMKYEQNVREWRNQRRDKAYKPVEKDW